MRILRNIYAFAFKICGQLTFIFTHKCDFGIEFSSIFSFGKKFVGETGRPLYIIVSVR